MTDQIIKLRQEGLSIRKIAQELNVPKNRVEKALKDDNNVHGQPKTPSEQPSDNFETTEQPFSDNFNGQDSDKRDTIVLNRREYDVLIESRQVSRSQIQRLEQQVQQLQASMFNYSYQEYYLQQTQEKAMRSDGELEKTKDEIQRLLRELVTFGVYYPLGRFDGESLKIEDLETFIEDVSQINGLIKFSAVNWLDAEYVLRRVKEDLEKKARDLEKSSWSSTVKVEFKPDRREELEGLLGIVD